MKLFLDSANLTEIKEAVSFGVIDGVTTNPTLVAKEGADFKKLLAEICQIVKGPVSAEVIGQETDEMITEAKELAAIADNVVIKIPMTPAGLVAVSALKAQGIDSNVTLIFSFNQALLAASAGAAFVSAFLGRLDDLGHDGIALIRQMSDIFKSYNIKSEIIAASIRHPLHVVQAAQAGADVATIPYKVLKQMFNHPLTEAGIERFLSDWHAAQGK
jgi:transaldolase